MKLLIKKLFFSFFLTLIFLVLIGIFLFLYYSKDLPDPKSLDSRVIPQSTKIYDRTGKILLYEIHLGEKRTLVKLNDISPYVIKAVLAAEDHRFFKHHGFVLQGILRGLIKSILNPSQVQGGSTITQQLARNAFLTLDKTLKRKIKEAILTFLIERKYSKNEILEMYLNQINFGYNVYGIESASLFYFDKPAKELTLSESVYLVSLINAPGYYSPYGSHKDELEKRKNWILERMAQLKYISQEEKEKAQKEIVVFSPLKIRQNFLAPHFVMYVKEQLAKKFTEEELAKGGYTIITTLDMNLQKIAEEVVQKYGDFNEKNVGSKNMALLAEDPKTGQILAMVGSRDYWNIEKEGNVNVTLSVRQPGSSFKPIVYAMAFLKGFYPESVVFDVALDQKVANFSTDPKNPYYVRNYDEKTRGPVTLRQALAQSLNIPSVKVLYLAGIQDTIQLAKKMGITTLNKPPSYYGLSLVLGGGGVKLIEMVHAYSVFANDGFYQRQSVILEIRDSQGKIIEKYQEQKNRVLPSQIARLITDILKDNEARAPTFGWNSPLYFPNYEVAVKTGTDTEYRDAWTIGYTTSLVAGVWAGNNDRSPVSKTGALASMVAAPCWHEFMERAFQYYPPSSFLKPEPYSLENVKTPMVNGRYIVEKKYKNSLTGEIKTFKEIHTILYYLNPNDPQFLNWELPVILWAQTHIPNFNQEYNQNIPPEYVQIEETQNSPDYIYFPENTSFEIITPKDGENISENPLVLKIKITKDPTIDILKTNIFLNDIYLGEMQKENNENIYSFQIPLEKLSLINKIKIQVIDSSNQTTEKEISVYKNN
jgi:1A family penicillin-binding protein